ncbi:response regulator transcription factor, partial [Shigella flexneri]|nr:DNA-binding response regulator [Shigella flexneri]EKD2097106.1 DNA-binding response regulator [Escherichia coli]EHZ3957937.1 DNA-binding response regulator [Shigella flexneri]EKP8314728.1 DNA-binding response regulator [Shigella flexneri]ELE9251964.1 DNA-binding response regulator [Shigella flexneri]
MLSKITQELLKMNNVLLMRPDDSEFMIPDDWSGLNAKGITYEQDNRVTESF